MRRKSLADKLEQKRATWIGRTATILGIGEEAARALLATERRQSIRLNPLKAPPAKTLQKLQALGWSGLQYEWMPLGYSSNTPLELIRDSKPIQNGEAFIQNAASWLPILALDPKPGEFILDVCAAPGGKTSHMAAITNNQARIWANDSSKPRLLKMQALLDLLGAKVERVTMFDAQTLARRLEGAQFDKILIDAPCSSEGLRSLASDKDVLGWSVAHIKRLQHEQKRIIAQAWQLLKPGCTLVYSTCTMAPEENEAVIDYLLRTHSDARISPFNPDLPNRVPTLEHWNERSFTPAIQDCLRLAPSTDLEAFFVCKLEKLAISASSVL